MPFEALHSPELSGSGLPSPGLPLRLVPDGAEVPVAGLVLERKAATAVLQRLWQRLPHYASLRLFATSGFIVLLCPEAKPLPWSEQARFFLRQKGPAILPLGFRLDVPERWHDDIVARLAASQGQSLPLLILPGQQSSGLQVTGLASALALADVDLPRLAKECAA